MAGLKGAMRFNLPSEFHKEMASHLFSPQKAPNTQCFNLEVIYPLFAAKQAAVLIFGCYVASLIYNVLSMLHLGRTRSYIGMFVATLPALRLRVLGVMGPNHHQTAIWVFPKLTWPMANLLNFLGLHI